MNLDQLYKGGKQDWAEAGGMELPVFLFFVTDIAATKKIIDGMYIDLDVRFNKKQDLAYHLEVPDLKMNPWAITIEPSQLERTAEAASMLNICMTMIMQPNGDSVKLTEYFEDLTHDFSGTYAGAHEAFAHGNISLTELLLTPLTEANPDSLPAAHHLLGRCYRAKNDFATAVQHYARGAKAATHTKGHFLPRASGILSDMGVSYKKMGEEAKAAHCLSHSLRLRPNHPSALGTYFTLFGSWEEGFIYCMTRIAAIGSDPEFVKIVAQSAGGALGRAPGQLESEANAAARNVDIARSPIGSTAPIDAAAFFQTLEATSGDAQRPVLTPMTKGTSVHIGDSSAPSTSTAKPWWKFW
jgi:tetratricopeptide (TPR) repeat protein